MQQKQKHNILSWNITKSKTLLVGDPYGHTRKESLVLTFSAKTCIVKNIPFPSRAIRCPVSTNPVQCLFWETAQFRRLLSFDLQVSRFSQATDNAHEFLCSFPSTHTFQTFFPLPHFLATSESAIIWIMWKQNYM